MHASRFGFPSLFSVCFVPYHLRASGNVGNRRYRAAFGYRSVYGTYDTVCHRCEPKPIPHQSNMLCERSVLLTHGIGVCGWLFMLTLSQRICAMLLLLLCVLQSFSLSMRRVDLVVRRGSVCVRSSYACIRAKFYRSCVQCALCSDSVRSHCKLLCLYFVLIFRHRLIAWLEVSTVCGCVFSEWW